GLGLAYTPVEDREVQVSTIAAARDPQGARLESWDIRAQTFSYGGLAGIPPQPKAPPAASPAMPSQADRLVIYNGSLSLQVAEPDRIEKEVTALAKEMGGWIQALDGARVTLRVP